eukprot:RCo013998
MCWWDPSLDLEVKWFESQKRRKASPAEHSVAHAVLEGRFTEKGVGLYSPGGAGKNPLLLLPWLGATLAGPTTAAASEKATTAAPPSSEVKAILSEVKDHLNGALAAKPLEVLSSWSGLRLSPARPPPYRRFSGKKRDAFAMFSSESGLLTVTGGNWTLYRQMAQAAVNHAIEVAALHSLAQPTDSRTVVLVGGHRYTPELPSALAQRHPSALTAQKAQQLVRTYGDRSVEVAELAAADGFRALPSPKSPSSGSTSRVVWETEVEYAIR